MIAHQPNRKKAQLNEELCLGCGVCVRSCSRNGLSLRVKAGAGDHPAEFDPPGGDDGHRAR